MAKLQVTWQITRLISISEEATGLGFDLRKYDTLHEDVQVSLKKATVSRVLKLIKETWDREHASKAVRNSFSSVVSGVYVISIGHGFGVRYKNGCSEVMYIGRGVLSNRLRSHLANWIFDMSRSLRDVPFKFYMAEITDGRSPDAFKNFEHHLLETFTSKFDEKPLLNKISGREGHIDHEFGPGSLTPVRKGKNILWEVRPSAKNDWFKPTSDD